MNDAEEMKHRIELLKMARELLNEEYINRRAEDHNRWLAECDVTWKTRGVKLPYPPFAPYPSEAEIVAKASSLFNFVKPDITSSESAAVDSSLSKREIDAVSKIKFGPAMQPAKETPWEHYLAPKSEIPVVEPMISTPESAAEIPKIGSPHEQILVPKIEIPSPIEVQTPVLPVPEPIPGAAKLNVSMPLPVAPEPLAMPRTMPAAMIIDPLEVSKPAVEESPASVSGIKNLLPSWLQRNQLTNKGTT